MVRFIDRLDMTIVVDWDVKPQTKQKCKLLTFFEMTSCFRGVTARKFVVFLRDFSRREKKWSARTYAKSRGVFSAKVCV